MLDEYRISYLLRRLNAAMVQYETEEMKDADVTPAQRILLHTLLKEEKSGLCASDICAASGLSKASVSVMLKALRNNGYLTMEHTPKDERRKKIILTEKAHAMQETVEQAVKKQCRQMCRGISEQELLLLEDLLQRMLHNLRDGTKDGVRAEGRPELPAAAGSGN